MTAAHPIQQSLRGFLEFTGTTSAFEKVEIRPRVSGYLQKVAFEEGAIVQAGDLLFEIERDQYEAKLASTKAAVQKAEAALRLAQAELKRANELIRRGALTREDLDVREANQATAEADVAAGRAEVRQAELDLGYTRITAPINGRVGRKLMDVGNLVQPQTTLLTTMEQHQPMYAYFTVSEDDLLRIMALRRAGIVASLKERPPEIWLELADETGFPHRGIVDFADLGIDPGTGTKQARAVFQNPDGRLVPGLFVRLRAPIGEPRPELMVPERAIARDQRGDYVLTLDRENTVEYRPVRLGMAHGDYRVILEGLQLEDRIVTNGLQRARPGTKVKAQLVELKVPPAEPRTSPENSPSPESSTSPRDSTSPQETNTPSDTARQSSASRG